MLVKMINCCNCISYSSKLQLQLDTFILYSSRRVWNKRQYSDSFIFYVDIFTQLLSALCVYDLVSVCLIICLGNKHMDVSWNTVLYSLTEMFILKCLCHKSPMNYRPIHILYIGEYFKILLQDQHQSFQCQRSCFCSLVCWSPP